MVVRGRGKGSRGWERGRASCLVGVIKGEVAERACGCLLACLRFSPEEVYQGRDGTSISNHAAEVVLEGKLRQRCGSGLLQGRSAASGVRAGC